MTHLDPDHWPAVDHAEVSRLNQIVADQQAVVLEARYALSWWDLIVTQEPTLVASWVEALRLALQNLDKGPGAMTTAQHAETTELAQRYADELAALTLEAKSLREAFSERSQSYVEQIVQYEAQVNRLNQELEHVKANHVTIAEEVQRRHDAVAELARHNQELTHALHAAEQERNEAQKQVAEPQAGGGRLRKKHDE